MSKSEKELWTRAKKEIITKNVIISPNAIGGILV